MGFLADLREKMGFVAGAEAVKAIPAAQTVYKTVGHSLLSDTSRNVVGEAVQNFGEAALRSCGDTAVETVLSHTAQLGAKQGAKALTKEATKRGVKSGMKQGGKALAKRATKGALTEGAKQSAKAATKEILKGACRAAGIGAAIDGTCATAEALASYRNGSMDGRSALKHVVTETATGGIATGAGVAVAAGCVAVTGIAAAPLIAGIGMTAALGAKLGLNQIFKRK